MQIRQFCFSSSVCISVYLSLLFCLSSDILSFFISSYCSFSRSLEQIESEWAPNYVQVQPETLPTLSDSQTFCLVNHHQHSHTQMQTALSGSLSRAFGACAACTVIILQWIISQSSLLLQDGVKEQQWDTWHVSSCNVRLQSQETSSRVSESLWLHWWQLEL